MVLETVQLDDEYLLMIFFNLCDRVNITLTITMTITILKNDFPLIFWVGCVVYEASCILYSFKSS